MPKHRRAGYRGNCRPWTRPITCIRSPTSRSSAQRQPRHHAGRGHLPVGFRRQPHPRRHGGPVVRQRRLRPQGTGRCRLRADAATALLQQLLPDHAPAGDRAGRAAGGGDARRPQPRVLHRLRLRGQRHRGAHGASLLGVAGRARQDHHHQPGKRLSRQHHGRRQPGRHEAHARAGRSADPGHRAHRAALLVWQRRRHEPGRVRAQGGACAGGKDRGTRRRARGGLHRRADPGRGRRDRPAGQLLAGDQPHLRASTDILLVADEVICGFGRTGHWFGSQTYRLSSRT